MTTHHHADRHAHHDKHHATFDRERAAKFNEWAAETLGPIMGVLSPGPGLRVADIGAGGGAFTVAFARAIGADGVAVAVDTYPEMLAYVAGYADGLGVGNVETLLAAAGGEDLPDAAYDLIYMRQVYHHLDEPTEYLRHVRRALAPGGRVAIIDFIPGSGHGPKDHAATVEEIVASAARAGLTPIEYSDSLVEWGRSFTIFADPSAAA